MNLKNKYIFIIAVIFILIVNFIGLFNVINDKIYADYLTLNRQKDQSTEIIIVEIDDKSIKALGKWPWKRSIINNLVTKVISARPVVIGICLSFTEPEKDTRNDEILYKTIQSFENIVLASKLALYEDDKITLKYPVKSIFPDVTQGHEAFQYSNTGTVISFPAKLKIPAFSLEVMRQYTKAKPFQSNYNLKNLLLSLDNKDDYNSKIVLIDYKRPYNAFKYYSAIDILNDSIPPELIKNKIVLIGLTDKTLTSVFSTPFTGEKTLASTGVQIQAQIIDSLINYRGLQKTPEVFVYLFSLLILVLFLFLTSNKRIIMQGFYFTSTLIAIAIADFILFKTIAIWFPPALLFVFIIITFAISMYLTTSQVDKNLIESFNKLQQSDNIPLIDIPSDIGGRVQNLSALLDVINTDRQTIKAIIDGVDNGILVINNKGYIEWTNGKLMSLFKDSLILNQHIEKIFKEIKFEDICQQIQTQKAIYKKELVIDDLEFLCVINPIKTDKQQFVAIFNNITQFKKMDRLKTDLVRMVSHELKTPLAGINICAENIVDIDNREESIKNAENIIYASELLLETINNFLNLSRLENDMIKLELFPISLIDTMQECIKLHEVIAKNKNINITFKHDNISSFKADKKHLQIVFNNLLSNAIKYSEKDSDVAVSINNEDQMIRISIQDSGIGIPENETKKIFEKFYRSKNNLEGNVKGTGIGLAITKKIVEIHNGSITVNSIVGKGSTFTVMLPIT